MSSIIDSVLNNPALSWASFAAILLIIEVVTPGGFFLPFAASSLLLAAAAFTGVLPQSFLPQVVLFAALGLALIPVARKLLRRYSDTTPDINKY
jgi:membrane protein implicated in regulation of membrane protease activity